MCQGNPAAPYTPRTTPQTAGAGSQLNPQQRVNPLQPNQTLGGYGPNVNYGLGFGPTYTGGNTLGGTAGYGYQQPITNTVAPQPVQPATQPNTSTVPTTTTNGEPAAPVLTHGPQVRTQIVTGGPDVYRKALAGELNKKGNLRKGVGVI